MKLVPQGHLGRDEVREEARQQKKAQKKKYIDSHE